MSVTFKTEADLCAAFIGVVPKDWTVYPETGGFDIVLCHGKAGVQIGIEAKLVLNAKVLCQVTEYRERAAYGPDFRAVLVGKSVAENAVLATRLGIKVLEIEERRTGSVRPRGTPASPWQVRGYNWLPEFESYRTTDQHWWNSNGWTDEAPSRRLDLPEYVPHVASGVPAPTKLTGWTIKAIKLCILVQKIETVTRAHFEALSISPTRWCDGYWLSKAQRGHWRAGPDFPADRFRSQHPITWGQIEADFPIWGAAILKRVGSQPSLLGDGGAG